MQNESASLHTLELSEIITGEGVTFDPEAVTLQGVYSDELSTYRARKMWVETLELNFLLESDHDFIITVSSFPEQNIFMLSCQFLTACARYAFWRITNNQAPEAQYMIETAHIPMCESRHEDILRAPDMRSIYDDNFYQRPSRFLRKDHNNQVLKALQRILACFK